MPIVPGVLRVQIRALRQPYCPTEVETRWWYLFGETIQNVSRFWNRCGSHWEEETAISIVLQDKWGSAEMATAVYDCGYEHATGTDTGVDVNFLRTICGRRS